MNLWTLIPADIQTVSVIGMAKNAGKTMTLNRLIVEAREAGKQLGLTSIGRDGELEDVVTGTEKPGIEVDRGMLLATTDMCLDRSDARVEILETTDERTPVGQVVIVRVKQRGRVELAGPDTSSGIRRVCQVMLARGAKQVLVDGALNRKSSASPAITDASILSSGAVLDRDMHRVVKETAHQIHLLELPLWEPRECSLKKMKPEDRGMDKWLPKAYAAGVMSENGMIRALNLSTALNSGKEIGRAMMKTDQGVLIRGSLTGRTLKDLASCTDLYRHMPLIIEDATRIFISGRDWQIWQKRGLRICVLRKTKLLFVTINPWSPGGWRFDGQTFLDEMIREADPVRVINVMGGEESK
ncbi:MAG: hypothetical protein SCK57_05370 [Bacillota bacterium]|nr:hypothetical protein [Bacillota bacterium]MDW7677071.1 hypothetical protein [Bacillota bacterium]